MFPSSVDMSDSPYDPNRFADIPLRALTGDGSSSVHAGPGGDLRLLSGTNGTGIEMSHLKPTANGDVHTIHSLLSLEDTMQTLDAALEQAVESMKNGVTPAIPRTHLGLLNDTVLHLKWRKNMEANKNHQIGKAFQSYHNVTNLEAQKQAESNGELIRQLERLAPADLKLSESYNGNEIQKLAEGIQRIGYEFGEQGLKRLLSWVEREHQDGDFANIPYGAYTDNEFSCSSTNDDMSFTSGDMDSLFCRIQRNKKESNGSESIRFNSKLSKVDTLQMFDSVYKQQMAAETLQEFELGLLLDARIELASRIMREDHKRNLAKGVFRLYTKVADSEGKGKADTNKDTIKQLKELASPEFSVNFQTEIQNLAEAIQRYRFKVDEDGMGQLIEWIERAAQVKDSRRRLKGEIDAD
jgi:hypothetical protein